MLRVLDLFCCAGGAAMGLHRAGFEVVGVDLEPQKRYPFEFHQADALAFPLDGFDFIWASPPCQGYTEMRHAPGARASAPRLIPQVRERLAATGLPWCIENVEDAAWDMRDPVTLCGSMLGLGAQGCQLRRHRLFETNFFWLQPGHPRHEWRIRGGHTLAGRARQVGFTERYTKPGRPNFGFDKVGSGIGHGGGAVLAREAMGVEWMSRDESSQAIPPAYTEFIGKQLMAVLL